MIFNKEKITKFLPRPSSLEALVPFSIALAILVFAFIPGRVQAAPTTYYIDVPNLGLYGDSGYGYQSYGQNYGQGYGYGCGNPCGSNSYYPSSSYGSYYPNYTYQYYQNPAPRQQNYTYTAPYVPMKTNYTPYPFPTYVPYVKRADGTYGLGQPQTPPVYPWNADNSIPTGSMGYGGYSGYTGYPNYTGSTGSGYGNYNPYSSYSPSGNNYGINNAGGFIMTSGY